MLTLPTKYRNDTLGNVTSISTLIVINTDPIIHISNDKGNLITSTIVEGTPEEIIEGTELLTYEEFYNEMDGLFPGTDEQIAELHAVIDTYEELYPPLWAFAHEIMDWFYAHPSTPTPNVYAVTVSYTHLTLPTIYSV